jgi:hypothetical protein
MPNKMKYPSSLEPTRYELALERGEQKYLICYSVRQGRHSILTAIRSRFLLITTQL